MQLFIGVLFWVVGCTIQDRILQIETSHLLMLYGALVGNLSYELSKQIVRKPLTHVYIIFDGRATYNINEASVVEYLGKVSFKNALHTLKHAYKDQAVCLCEYELDGTKLINGRVVSIQG